MAYRKIDARWRYQHCRDIGVAADYCILQFRHKDAVWRTAATCHPSAIAVFKTDGVKAHIDLLKLART
jgi:hypothetical protein